MENQTADRSGELTTVQKIVAVFTSPSRAFASIELNPSILVPFIIIAIINLIFVLVAGDVILNETMTQQEAKLIEQGLEGEQLTRALEMTETATRYMTPFMAVVAPMVIILLVAAVFLFVGNVILGGKASYKSVLGVTAWSWLILSLAGLVMLPLVMAKQSLLVSFSLAAFLADEARETFMYQLLSKVDLFFAWWIGAYSIGLAVLYKMKTQKVATAVVVVYALYAVVASSIAVIFS